MSVGQQQDMTEQHGQSQDHPQGPKRWKQFLDGIALALELVAGRVETYGIQGIASLLDNHVTFHLRGAAPPRHASRRSARRLIGATNSCLRSSAPSYVGCRYS
jgi:hypothetical protein